MISTPASGLFSPIPSASSPPSSTAQGGNGLLPPTRTHPLRPGSHKEIALINYVDDKMLRMTRRYAKKYNEHQPNDDAPGYTSFDQVVEDLSVLFEVVWISGTRKRLCSAPQVRACHLAQLCLRFNPPPLAVYVINW